VTEGEAREIASAHLRSMMQGSGIEVVIIGSATIEKSYGWIFFYDSKEFLESGNFSDRLAGNAPIVVAKADGRIHTTGTAYPLQHYLERLTAAEGWQDQ
jgi:immunity protein 35 of polymorphic toxin system